MGLVMDLWPAAHDQVLSVPVGKSDSPPRLSASSGTFQLHTAIYRFGRWWRRTILSAPHLNPVPHGQAQKGSFPQPDLQWRDDMVPHQADRRIDVASYLPPPPLPTFGLPYKAQFELLHPG